MNSPRLVALAISTIAFAEVASAQDIDFSKVQIKTIDLGHNTAMLRLSRARGSLAYSTVRVAASGRLVRYQV